MNALEFLKDSHETVKDLLEKLAATTARGIKTRESLFNKLRHEVTTHAQIERELFYPRLGENADNEVLATQAEAEHLLVEQLIDQLDELDYNEESWEDKFEVLKENLEHHLEEEEADAFPQMEDLLSEEELEALGEDMKQMMTDLTEEPGQEDEWHRRHAA